jgi:phospholipase/carboxylesterase
LRRRRIAIIAAAAVAAAAVAIVFAVRPRRPPLEVLAYGREGPPTFVLLHGYGSKAEDWIPFVDTIRIPAGGRFVFPRAPGFTVPPDGPVGGRGWWHLDLAAHIPPGRSIPDLSATRPAGIRDAAARVGDLLARIELHPGGPVVLGGFSQGAMIASQVAFESDAPLVGLILLSGTLVDEATWQKHYARRQGLPVFIAHGRSDQVLPFRLAQRMREQLQEAGLQVTWHPFAGGHEIPAEVVDDLNRFIARLSLGRVALSRP